MIAEFVNDLLSKSIIFTISKLYEKCSLFVLLKDNKSVDYDFFPEVHKFLKNSNVIRTVSF